MFHIFLNANYSANIIGKESESNLLAGLTSDHLTSIFNCFTTAKALNKPDETALGVFIQKLDKIILNEALDKFNNKSKAIILRYLTTSGMLNATALNVIGGRVLCLLDESQLQTISPTDISNATPLDISSCSQSKKNLIYNKAKSVIEKQNSDSVTYYNQMKTYLGGATIADIRTLAANNFDMDPNVFLALNPEELKKLSPDELKNFLGVDLQTVKDAENSALVRAWISQNTESEVRNLGIGLTGGNPDPVPITISALILEDG